MKFGVLSKTELSTEKTLEFCQVNR